MCSTTCSAAACPRAPHQPHRPHPGEPELRAAARQLAGARFLLEEDVELAVRQALAEQSRE